MQIVRFCGEAIRECFKYGIFVSFKQWLQEENVNFNTETIFS